MKKTLLILAAISFFACSKKITIDTRSSEELAMNYSDASVDQLKSGKALFIKTCNMCHGLEKSYGVSNERLTEVVPGMVGKANKKAGQILISPEGGENILHYLKALNAK